MLWVTLLREILGCGRKRGVLDTRTDRNRDHVLLKPFLVADASICSCGERVHNAVRGRDFDLGIGLLGQKTRQKRRQYQPRSAHRYVQPQRSGRRDDRRLVHPGRQRPPDHRQPPDLGQPLRFPSDLKPYGDAWAASGNNIEVNFMPDYKHLHDAGYNVLAYDLRAFGQNGAGSGRVTGKGIREYRDFIGSMRYVRSRPDLQAMKVGLLSRCCGMNATMVGMAKHPEEFEGVQAIVAPQPISLSSFYVRSLITWECRTRFPRLPMRCGA
jgi:hypothetical protein